MQIKTRLPMVLLIVLLCSVCIYNFSYYFPFTNNAFVVANIRPVAANVTGYITDIYVNNGDYVEKGQPLFTVFKKPYELAFKKASSDVKEAQAQRIALMKTEEITHFLIESEQQTYKKIQFEYLHNQSALKEQAVSKVMVNNLRRKMNAAMNKLNALKKELELNHQRVIVQESKIESLTAVMDNAKVDLDETTVYAKNNGVIQNMFVALGTPIKIRKPIFSFVDTDHMYVQANFNETDLTHVRAGNKVTIRPRIYLGIKHYQGVVVSKHWAASRQITDPRSQQQIVTNNVDSWILLPQRFPVQIKIIDYDPVHYPLSIGASAYINIKTD